LIGDNKIPGVAPEYLPILENEEQDTDDYFKIPGMDDDVGTPEVEAANQDPPIIEIDDPNTIDADPPQFNFPAPNPFKTDEPGAAPPLPEPELVAETATAPVDAETINFPHSTRTRNKPMQYVPSMMGSKYSYAAGSTDCKC
jgi:hypothetical protein